MNRRTFLAALSSPAAIALLQACSDDTGSVPGTTAAVPSSSLPGPDDAEARSGAPRVSADPTLAKGAARALNLLGNDLYSSLAAGNTENLVFSAASISLALAMTRAGARGTTATEMDAVLHTSEIAADPQVLHRALNALTVALESRSGEFTVENQTFPVELAIANSLWGQRGITWLPEFLDLLAAEYGAGMRLVDYRGSTDASRVAINQWVSSRTKDRIPELLAAGTITPDTVLTLVNAVYLKAPWQTPFPLSATADRPFNNASGTTIQVPMMSVSESMLHAQGDGWQSVELPYVGGGLAMTVLVPDTGRLADIEQRLGEGLLDTVVATQGTKTVVLGLPRFEVETKVELAQVMSALGMPTAFQPGVADFSGMTSDAELFIGLVVHQANITVDEKGTEAAAATAVTMRETSVPVDIVRLEVDRPFMFAVRDLATGTILFLGRVTTL